MLSIVELFVLSFLQISNFVIPSLISFRQEVASLLEALEIAQKKMEELEVTVEAEQIKVNLAADAIEEEEVRYSTAVAISLGDLSEEFAGETITLEDIQKYCEVNATSFTADTDESYEEAEDVRRGLGRLGWNKNPNCPKPDFKRVRDKATNQGREGFKTETRVDVCGVGLPPPPPSPRSALAATAQASQVSDQQMSDLSTLLLGNPQLLEAYMLKQATAHPEDENLQTLLRISQLHANEAKRPLTTLAVPPSDGQRPAPLITLVAESTTGQGTLSPVVEGRPAKKSRSAGTDLDGSKAEAMAQSIAAAAAAAADSDSVVFAHGEEAGLKDDEGKSN